MRNRRTFNQYITFDKSILHHMCFFLNYFHIFTLRFLLSQQRWCSWQCCFVGPDWSYAMGKSIAFLPQVSKIVLSLSVYPPLFIYIYPPIYQFHLSVYIHLSLSIYSSITISLSISICLPRYNSFLLFLFLLSSLLSNLFYLFFYSHLYPFTSDTWQHRRFRWRQGPRHHLRRERGICLGELPHDSAGVSRWVRCGCDV